MHKRFRYANRFNLIFALVLGLIAVPVNAGSDSKSGSDTSATGIPEKEIGRWCSSAAKAYVNGLVASRDSGVSKPEALSVAITDWAAFKRRNGFFMKPLPDSPLTEIQQSALRLLAERYSVFVYELPRATSEVLEIVATEQCDRALRDRRQLTLDELKIRIYGVEVCANSDRHVRYQCLSALFSATAQPAVPAKNDIASLNLTAQDVGLESIFPSATISFTQEKSYTLLKGYRFKVSLGALSPRVPHGVFTSGMAYLGGPYQLFWCGMRHLGSLIGKDIVLTKVYEDRTSGFDGLAIFVDADSPFSLITSSPVGGESLSLMHLNKIQTKCEKLKTPGS